MTDKTDILIIGGGISGLLTARELALAGCQVTVLERKALGRESSWAGGGILLPIYPWRQPAAISELVVRSIARYPQLHAELLAATGIDPEWSRCGMLICKNPDRDAAISWCQHYGVAYHCAAPQPLAAIHSEYRQPLWLPEIAQIRNPRLLKSLTAYLRQIGVRFVENAEIEQIGLSGNRLTSLTTGEQTFHFQQLVITAGAWSAALLDSLLPHHATDLPVRPVKGQMLLFAAQPDTLNTMVLDGDQYLIPRRDGKILAGSTVEDAGFDKTTTAVARQQLYDFAVNLLPALKAYPVESHWAGLRPGSPQGVPTIGLHPEISNLAINVGHFRNGLVMGPASARLLADLLLQRSPELDPQAYAWRV